MAIGLLSAFPASRATALLVTRPIVGMAATPDGGGYWEVASDGGIFGSATGLLRFRGRQSSQRPDRRHGVHAGRRRLLGGRLRRWHLLFGDAAFYGSQGGQHLDAPIVGMASSPSGGGYWEVASDGGIFVFGNAGFHGSEGGQHLDAPIVGMASTGDGGGYWEVASDGGIFVFGNAGFHGSEGGQHLNDPIVGMASTADGGGYWEVASDGGIFAFGDATFWGSTGSLSLDRPIVGMVVTPAEPAIGRRPPTAASSAWAAPRSTVPCRSCHLPGHRGSLSTATPLPRRRARILPSSQAGRGHRCESARIPGPLPATSSRQWPLTRRNGSPPPRSSPFQGMPSRHAWMAISSERRSTTRSTKPIPRRRSRSSGPLAPRSSWSGSHLTRPPASVRTSPVSTRSSNRWQTTTSASRTTMPARR